MNPVADDRDNAGSAQVTRARGSPNLGSRQDAMGRQRRDIADAKRNIGQRRREDSAVAEEEEEEEEEKGERVASNAVLRLIRKSELQYRRGLSPAAQRDGNKTLLDSVPPVLPGSATALPTASPTGGIHLSESGRVFFPAREAATHLTDQTNLTANATQRTTSTASVASTFGAAGPVGSTSSSFLIADSDMATDRRVNEKSVALVEVQLKDPLLPSSPLSQSPFEPCLPPDPEEGAPAQEGGRELEPRVGVKPLRPFPGPAGRAAPRPTGIKF